MGGASKNSRTAVTTHKFACPCGGEVIMKTLFESGKLKNVAECTQCKRVERRRTSNKKLRRRGFKSASRNPEGVVFITAIKR